MPFWRGEFDGSSGRQSPKASQLELWLAFFAIVATLLTLDLGVLHEESREIEVRESLLLSAGYIVLLRRCGKTAICAGWLRLSVTSFRTGR